MENTPTRTQLVGLFVHLFTFVNFLPNFNYTAISTYRAICYPHNTNKRLIGRFYSFICCLLQSDNNFFVEKWNYCRKMTIFAP